VQQSNKSQQVAGVGLEKWQTRTI